MVVISFHQGPFIKQAHTIVHTSKQNIGKTLKYIL